MPDREHTSKHYEQQMRELKDKLLLMSHQAEQMISDSIRALVDRRPALAEEVIKRDDDLDRLEIAIDNLCYEILALEQPVARDLRFIATALKIVKDIERIGEPQVRWKILWVACDGFLKIVDAEIQGLLRAHVPVAASLHVEI